MGKRPSKPKLTDSERHARFVETARKVEAPEDQKDFDEAFKKIVSPSKTTRKASSQDDA